VEPIVVTDTPARTVSIRLALEDVVITESRFSAGEVGTEPHVHRLHADCFYVLDGALTVPLDDGDRVLGPGTFALIPPNVVHAFRNDGPGEVRYLNLHAPGCGFDRYLQGLYEPVDQAPSFDQRPPPEEGGLDPAGVLVRSAETDAVRLGDVRIGFLAEAGEALGAIGLAEYTAPPSFPGPPAHVHDRTWDAYYVLEGRLRMRLGEESRDLEPGDLLAVPPGTVHGFANTLTDASTRFLGLHAPGGFERYFREAAAAFGNGPPDPDAMREIARTYDVRPATHEVA
jgi:mannose-6-phosphate isomerase-like protein (cupin superfamily)